MDIVSPAKNDFRKIQASGQLLVSNNYTDFVSYTVKYPRGVGNRSSYGDFRVIKSQIFGWVALGVYKIVRVIGRFEL